MTEALQAADGGNINAQDDLGGAALHVIVSFVESPAVTKALLAAGADISVRDKLGCTPLHGAAQLNGNPAVIETLLAAGAEVDCRNDFGSTPLHDAAGSNGNPAVIETLLAAGADINACGMLGTPLHDAAGSNGNLAVIEALLTAGADISALDEFGYTPLHLAAKENGNPAVVEALLTAGADIGALDEFGYTPLHLAAKENGNPAVVEALLAAGADPSVRSHHGERPLDLALKNKALQGADCWQLDIVAGLRRNLPNAGASSSAARGPSFRGAGHRDPGPARKSRPRGRRSAGSGAYRSQPCWPTTCGAAGPSGVSGVRTAAAPHEQPRSVRIVPPARALAAPGRPRPARLLGPGRPRRLRRPRAGVRVPANAGRLRPGNRGRRDHRAGARKPAPGGSGRRSLHGLRREPDRDRCRARGGGGPPDECRLAHRSRGRKLPRPGEGDRFPPRGRRTDGGLPGLRQVSGPPAPAHRGPDHRRHRQRSAVLRPHLARPRPPEVRLRGAVGHVPRRGARSHPAPFGSPVGDRRRRLRCPGPRGGNGRDLGADRSFARPQPPRLRPALPGVPAGGRGRRRSCRLGGHAAGRLLRRGGDREIHARGGPMRWRTR